MFNKVIVSGRLTRDPELKYASGGTLAICNFSIAIARIKKKEYPIFIEITAFNKTADFINSHFKKGDMILVEGTLDYQQWKNDKGETRTKVSVMCEKANFFGSNEEKKEKEKDANKGIFEVLEKNTVVDEISNDDIPF